MKIGDKVIIIKARPQGLKKGLKAEIVDSSSMLDVEVFRLKTEDGSFGWNSPDELKVTKIT